VYVLILPASFAHVQYLPQIGYHVAKGSLEHGAKVVIASSNAEKVEAAVKSLSERHEGFKGSISGYACDARDEADLEKFWDKVGRFDHLVCVSPLLSICSRM